VEPAELTAPVVVSEDAETATLANGVIAATVRKATVILSHCGFHAQN
jgi:hypothetical protein